MADFTLPYLLSIMDGEPVISTLAIASLSGLKHPSVYRNVVVHSPRFLELGSLVPRQRERLSGDGVPLKGGSLISFYWLNEAQATLVLTIMRNLKRTGECVLDRKQLLADVFAGMRRDLRVSEMQPTLFGPQ